VGLDVAAGNIEIARDRHKADQRPGRVEGVDVVLDGVSPLDRRRFGGGVSPGGEADLLGGHPGAFLHLFRGVGRDMGGQLREPLGPFLHEFPVVKTLFDDYMNEAQRQGGIGTRTDLEPVLGLFCQVDATRVDDDELRAVLELFQKEAADLPLFVGGGDVAAPEDDFHRKIRVGDTVYGSAAVLLAPSALFLGDFPVWQAF